MFMQICLIFNLLSFFYKAEDINCIKEKRGSSLIQGEAVFCL